VVHLEVEFTKHGNELSADAVVAAETGEAGELILVESNPGDLR